MMLKKIENNRGGSLLIENENPIFSAFTNIDVVILINNKNAVYSETGS